MERAPERIWEDRDFSRGLQVSSPESQFPFIKEEWYTNTCSILVNGLKKKIVYYYAHLHVLTQGVDCIDEEAEWEKAK